MIRKNLRKISVLIFGVAFLLTTGVSEAATITGCSADTIRKATAEDVSAFKARGKSISEGTCITPNEITLLKLAPENNDAYQYLQARNSNK